jgi:hypothetical protein
MHTISLGMFVAGACYLSFRLSRWFATNKKGHRNWKELLPLAIGMLLTMVASACTGGLVGWVMHAFGWVQGQAGNVALTAGTGAHGVNATTSRDFGVLSQFGSAVLLIFMAGVAGVWKHVNVTAKVDLRGGGWVGAALGPLVGGYTLIPAINDLGLHTVGRLFGAA